MSEATGRSERSEPVEVVRGRSAARLASLSVAMWGGLVAWGAHLLVAMGLVGAACSHGLLWAVHLATAVTAVGAGASVVVGVRVWQRTGGADTEAWDVPGRERLMAGVGVLLSSLGLALILLEGFPAFVVDPCSA